MENELIVCIIIFALLLLMDMFFYGFGEAVRNLNRKELDERVVENEDKRYVLLSQIADEPSEYINTLQVFATGSLILSGALYYDMLIKLGGRLRLLLLLVPVYILLSFGVLMPKKVAARYPEKFALTFIRPAVLLIFLLKPVTGLVSLTVKCTMRILGVVDQGTENEQIEDEIINMVHEGHEQGLIEESEAQMISNIFAYGDKEAKDIMTNRNYVTAIDEEETLDEAVRFMLQEKFSRFPVYRDNIDHITGILHMKDALRYRDKTLCGTEKLKNIRGLLRKPVYIMQTKKIDELFRQMQKDKLHMVIVIDEYGQTDGLVAMEDILEEIVGNIEDEYDDEKEYIKQRGNDLYVIEGTTPLNELEERLDITFDDERFDTINGFLIERLDRIPEPNEKFQVEYKGYQFKILKVANKMITSVLVRRLVCDNIESSLEQNPK